VVPVLSMGARDGSSTGSRARRSWGKWRGRPVRACRGSGAFYRREGEEDQLASEVVVPGGGRFGQGGRRRQATASGDAIGGVSRRDVGGARGVRRRSQGGGVSAQPVGVRAVWSGARRVAGQVARAAYGAVVTA